MFLRLFLLELHPLVVVVVVELVVVLMVLIFRP
jgi:hypothetical protein